MNTESEGVKHKALTEEIINVFYKLYNRLGYGFLKKKESAIICVNRCPTNTHYVY
jgi:hypothetical protein